MKTRSAFWQGFVDCAPFILITIPYSMMFGVVARDAGLDVRMSKAGVELVQRADTDPQQVARIADALSS